MIWLYKLYYIVWLHYIIYYSQTFYQNCILSYCTILYYKSNYIISCYIMLHYNIRLCYMIRYTIRYHMISYCGKLNIESWRDVTDAMWYGVHHVSFPSGWGLNQAPQKKKQQSGTSFWRSKGATFVTSQEHFNHSYGVWCTHRFLYTQH